MAGWETEMPEYLSLSCDVCKDRPCEVIDPVGYHQPTMLTHLNNLLPASHQIDPAYVHAIAAKGFSEALQRHVMLDRLKARLRTLDTVGPPPPHTLA